MVTHEEKTALADRIEAEVPGLIWDRLDGGWPRFGGMMPWQGEGRLDGRPFYARFRHNQASLDIYTDDDRETEILSAVIWPYVEGGDVHLGWLEDDQIAPMLTALIEKLAPPSEDNPSSMMILERAVDWYLERMKAAEE